MHPVERLRAVARARGVDQSLLVQEAAVALADLAVSGDERGLVLAARRLLAHHGEAGAMWTLCSRLLQAGDPAREAWRVIEEIDGDGTALHARAYVAHHEADLVIEAAAGGPDGFLVSGHEGWAMGERVGPDSMIAVVLPWGRAVPERYWQIVRSAGDRVGQWTVVPRQGTTLVIGPDGVAPAPVVIQRVDCSVVPDLLIPSAQPGIRGPRGADPR
ncbi:MAG: hypothetical protein HYR89_00240 [Actinobacteria bacterium]|nr:hypothetical protein [Actinomycetota bacterium]